MTTITVYVVIAKWRGIPDSTLESCRYPSEDEVSRHTERDKAQRAADHLSPYVLSDSPMSYHVRPIQVELKEHKGDTTVCRRRSLARA